MPLELVTVPCRQDNYAFLLHDPQDGRTLLVDAPETAPVPEDAPTGAGLIPLALDEPFAGDELFRRAARLADRCPAPVVALHPEDAAARGLAAGTPVAVAGAAPVALTLDADVPRGHVAASVGRVLPRGARAPVTVEAAS